MQVRANILSANYSGKTEYTSWDFPTQPPLEFTENDPKKRNYPVSGFSSLRGKVHVEENGQTASC